MICAKEAIPKRIRGKSSIGNETPEGSVIPKSLTPKTPPIIITCWKEKMKGGFDCSSSSFSCPKALAVKKQHKIIEKII